MRILAFTTLAAASLLAGCNSRPAATTNTANTNIGNMTMDAPMNDQSAMESATNAGLAAPPPANSSNSSGDVLGETRGGDTGGNTVQSNVTGM